MSKQRVQKIIASSGICSRREAESYIKQNRVKVNGIISRIGDSADPKLDQIELDNSLVVENITNKVFILNKPIGVISSCNDPQGRPTVIDFIPTQLRKGIYPVGRLDCNSRGAIILTNCGDLTLHLTHPRFDHKKTYLVLLEGIPSQEKLNEWRQGIIVDGKKTRKASIEILESTFNKCLLRVILREGRNRQIRKIADIIGHPVIDLQRTSISNIHLNGLKEGEWRKIPPKEWMPIVQTNSNLMV